MCSWEAVSEGIIIYMLTVIGRKRPKDRSIHWCEGAAAAVAAEAFIKHQMMLICEMMMVPRKRRGLKAKWKRERERRVERAAAAA